MFVTRFIPERCAGLKEQLARETHGQTECERDARHQPRLPGGGEKAPFTSFGQAWHPLIFFTRNKVDQLQSPPWLGPLLGVDILQLRSQLPRKMAPKVKKSGAEENVTLGPATREGELVFGVAHIFASFNDTFVHVTDLSGKETLCRVTGGMKVKADRDESSPYAAMLAAQDVAVRCKVRGLVSGWQRIYLASS